MAKPKSTKLDLSGRRFGKLIAISYALNSSWNCKCDCGKSTVSYAGFLISGRTKSCGCAKAEKWTTHGLHRHPLYSVWHSIKQRCLDRTHRQFHNYGGRGITMHSAWVDDLAAFASHLGSKPSPQHSIDRIDNNKGYEPGNVRWATKEEQGNNRRSNRWVIYRGERYTVSQLSKKIADECESVTFRQLMPAICSALNKAGK